ncbi:MAG: ferric reductase-like transmembrane domain-containing protein [Desulforhopalus sp.]
MRFFYGGLIVTALLLFTAGALSIPFFYESTTLWYKMGLDKTMLQTGQVLGMLALVLLAIQIILAVRTRLLVSVFGLAAVMRYHRLNGVLVALVAFAHVVLVLAPEGFGNLPIGIKYWPEMVGGGLFLSVLFMSFSSHFRERLGLDYGKWRSVHKPLGYMTPFLLLVHVLFVSDSFEQVVPKIALLATFVVGLGLVLVSKKMGD